MYKHDLGTLPVYYGLHNTAMDIIHSHYKKNATGRKRTKERKRFANPERLVYHRTERQQRVLDQIMKEGTGQIECPIALLNFVEG
jgi:DNA modification methylase